MKADILACPDLRIGKQIVFHIIKGDVSYRFCIDDLVKFYLFRTNVEFCPKKNFFLHRYYLFSFFLQAFWNTEMELGDFPIWQSAQTGNSASTTGLVHHAPVCSRMQPGPACGWLKKPNTGSAAQSVYALLYIYNSTLSQGSKKPCDKSWFSTWNFPNLFYHMAVFYTNPIMFHMTFSETLKEPLNWVRPLICKLVKGWKTSALTKVTDGDITDTAGLLSPAGRSCSQPCCSHILTSQQAALHYHTPSCRGGTFHLTSLVPLVALRPFVPTELKDEQLNFCRFSGTHGWECM